MSKTAAELKESIRILEDIDQILQIKDRVSDALGELESILEHPSYKHITNHMRAYGNYGLDQFLNTTASNRYDDSIDTIIAKLRDARYESTLN